MSKESGTMSDASTSNTSRRGKRGALNNSVDGPSLKINVGLLVGFVEIFRTTEFQETFNHEKFNINAFFTWIFENGGSSRAAKSVGEVYNICQKKMEKHNEKILGKHMNHEKSGKDEGMSSKGTEQSAKKLMTMEDVLSTQQVRQIFRAALAIFTYGRNDGRIFEMFENCFVGGEVSPKYVIGTSYITGILGGSSTRNTVVLQKLHVKAPSRIEALLYFHAIRFVNGKSICSQLTYRVGNRIGFILQRLVDCWVRLLRNVQGETLGRFGSVIMPYIIYNRATGLFTVHKTRIAGFTNEGQERSLVDAYATNREEAVSVIAFSRSKEMDTALRYIIDMFFTHLHKMLEKSYLYGAADRDLMTWYETRQYDCPSVMENLPAVFHQLPDVISETLGITKPDALTGDKEFVDSTVVVDVDAVVEREQETARRQMKRSRSEEEETSPRENKMSKPTRDTEDGVEHLKAEPINSTVRPGRSSEISEEAEKAIEVVRKEMLRTALPLDSHFNQLEDDAAAIMSTELEDNVDLLLTDPPYNIRNEAGRDNSDHDTFSEDDMVELVQFARRVLKKGGHGIIFCAFLQFKKWYELISAETEMVTDYEADSSGNSLKPSQIFEVEPKPIHFLKKPGNFGNTNRRTFHHTNVVEVCIHFWKNSGNAANDKERVDYKTPSSYGGTYPSWSNVVTEIPNLPQDEVVVVPNETFEARVGRKKMLRPEQKNIGLLQFLINKFTKPGDLVVDTCAGTFSAMKACLLLDQHRRFAGADIDTRCIGYAEDGLVETYARQILNPKSDITEREPETKQAAQVIVREMERLSVRRRCNAWATPTGLVPMQNFPPHIVKFLCQYYEDFSLLRGRHFSMNQWNAQWIQRMNRMDVRHLRTFECTHLQVNLRKSDIKSPRAGLGLFADHRFAKGERIGYYYGALVYHDLGHNRKIVKRYGDGILSVSTEDFDKWSASINYRFVDAHDTEYDGYIAPAPFCVTRYINDSRYLDDDEATNEERKNNPRRANCQFLVNPAARCNRDFEQYTAVSIVATREIESGQELYLEYGDEYVF